MQSKSTKAFATRLPAADAELLEEAIDETGWTKAALVRRTIQYYAEENPDHIGVFYPEGSMEQFTRELVE